MKLITTLLALAVVLTSYGQERRKNVGLNRFIPDNVSAGIKIQTNIHSPSLAFRANTAVSTEITGNSQVGGGGGFYFRYDVKKHFSIQPEINFIFMSGSVLGSQVFVPDTAITVTKEIMTSYRTLNVEIPLNLKWRWELIAIRKGHYKANSAFGIFAGPRIILAPYSAQTIGKRTISDMYDQRSESIENPTNVTEKRYSPVFGLGIGAGLDLELYNGFILFGSYYRGLISNAIKTNRFKSFDNRFEIGIGVRFK